MARSGGLPAGEQAPPRPALPALTPMLAVAGELPSPAEDDRWAYETKWDGCRTLAFLDGGRVRLRSRNDLEVTVSYPELAGLGTRLGNRTAILDGEVVAFGTDGRPSFARLQRRMHVGRASQAQRLSGTDPVRYLIFDVLHLDGSATTGLPYRQRRELLADLQLDDGSWQCPPYFAGNGASVLRASQELELEGVVAKRLDSTYRPGRRSPDWRKIKNVRSQEVVVLGWQPGHGRRAGTIGSVLVGVPGEAGHAGAAGRAGKDRAARIGAAGLRYAGKVGTGFTDAALIALHRQLRPLARRTPALETPPPPAETGNAQWVEPRLVAEVGFGEWTPDGRLRHPVWRGLRPDKSVSDVRLES
ncbi:non-homologous end-joining DNA ligase [Jatrophihabitans sp.]|jgi:bifunctional non-homologous end joining protein LigD|uniref:non-homologous end-joining DNA ligase n=1 Tax=Jatrophihabitans sp. TaxID=1932789 RepID=UPI002F25A916